MENNDEIIDAEIISDSASELDDIDDQLEEISDQWKLVAYHLQNNHYPPVPLSMVDTCIRAIEYAEQGEWNLEVMLPEGTTYKGSTHASVETIVESHHLHYFIKDSDREVTTITAEDGTVIFQGYGSALNLENRELNTENGNTTEAQE